MGIKEQVDNVQSQVVDIQKEKEVEPESKQEQQRRLIAQAHLELHGVKLETTRVPMIAKEVGHIGTRIRGIEQELRLTPRHAPDIHHGNDHVLKVPEAYKKEFGRMNT